MVSGNLCPHSIPIFGDKKRGQLWPLTVLYQKKVSSFLWRLRQECSGVVIRRLADFGGGYDEFTGIIVVAAQT